MILIEIIYLLTGRTLLFLSSLLVRDKFLLINFVKFNRKKRGTLCELNEERGFAPIISRFTLKFIESASFLPVKLANSSPSSLLLFIVKFLLINFVKFEWKKRCALRRLTIKGEMMDAKPLSSLSSRRTHLFFSSLLSIR